MTDEVKCNCACHILTESNKQPDEMCSSCLADFNRGKAEAHKEIAEGSISEDFMDMLKEEGRDEMLEKVKTWMEDLELDAYEEVKKALKKRGEKK